MLHLPQRKLPGGLVAAFEDGRGLEQRLGLPLLGREAAYTEEKVFGARLFLYLVSSKPVLRMLTLLVETD